MCFERRLTDSYKFTLDRKKEEEIAGGQYNSRLARIKQFTKKQGKLLDSK